jgi:hypothetical protein
VVGRIKGGRHSGAGDMEGDAKTFLSVLPDQ